MTTSVFSAKGYRDFLWERVKEENGRGGRSKLAAAAKCQSSHITRVLNGSLQLTLDQAFRLAHFWHLDLEEETYFMKLVELDRASEPIYRSRLQAELGQMKLRQENLGQRLKKDTIETTGFEVTYYSAWHWSAIHIATSIPAYQTPSAIANYLGLPDTMVLQCLKLLEEQGLVERREGRWAKTEKNLHLGKHSPMNSVQHWNWRSRAVQSTQLPEEDGAHFTAVQSVSLDDFEKIKQIILGLIDHYARIANPSKEETVVCFLLDFFRAGRPVSARRHT